MLAERIESLNCLKTFIDFMKIFETCNKNLPLIFFSGVTHLKYSNPGTKHANSLNYMIFHLKCVRGHHEIVWEV